MPDFYDLMILRLSAVAPQAAAGLAVACVFWLVARFVGGAIMRMQGVVAEERKDLVSLLADVAGWGLFIIGLIAGLGTAGVNVAALVTGLGLTGFAIGFAMKDILSNLIAGVLVMLFRPYRLGDTVRIDKFQGKVAEVDLRYTTLEAPGAKVMIPNAKAHTEIVVVLQGGAQVQSLQSTAAPAVNVKAPTPQASPQATPAP